MNNNRNNNNNNNRRRGRGNNNRPQGGRGEQLNRIDSRARGNAPQLLEKYRKLASDAHLNGDRVNAEYYLQFADHYFRVIADARLRQEEQRLRRDDRPGDGGADDGDDGDYGPDNDFPSFDQPVYRRDEPREPQAYRAEPRRERPEPREADESERTQGDAADETQERANAPEPAGGNPFTRGNRSMRGLRPRGENRGLIEGDRATAMLGDGEPGIEGEPGLPGLDPAALPPAIAEAREAAMAVEAMPAPAPRRRTRRPRPPVDDAGGDPLEVVGG
ncbi:MAG: DUF4167 domain-containing protein [Novosphingobium sp.]